MLIGFYSTFETHLRFLNNTGYILAINFLTYSKLELLIVLGNIIFEVFKYRKFIPHVN